MDPWGFQYAADINVWDKIVAAALAAKEFLPAMPAITVSMPAVAATGLFGGILFYPSDIMPDPPIPLPILPVDEYTCPMSRDTENPIFEDGLDDLDQLDGIEDAQRKIREGALERKIIDSIEKSKQRVKNRLKQLRHYKDAVDDYE